MSVSSEWIKLGDSRNGAPVYYKKKEIYQMGWKKDKLNIEDYLIAVSKHGGPIAITKDPNKALIVQTNEDTIPYVFIYSSAGQLISKFVVNFLIFISSLIKDSYVQWVGH